MSNRKGLWRSACAVLVAVGAVGLGPRHAWASGAITKGPWVQRVTDTTAIVRIEVSPPAPATVELQTGTFGGSGDGGAPPGVITSEASSLHSFTLRDLRPSTRYAYKVRVGATSKFGSFVTAPRPDSDELFHFAVYGDNRTDDAAHAAVVRAMVSVPSDFLVHTGDFVERGGSAAQWQTFFDIEAPLLATRAHYSCVGNHELTDGAGIEYARYFGPTDLPVDPARSKDAPAATKPEHLDGTFRWGNTRFFFLNGMVSYRASVDRTWLEKALAEADAEPGLVWRIVVVHQGPWSSGPHGGNARLRDAGVIQLLKEHDVDLVVSGHDHIYERGWAEGLPYLVSGGGGAPLYRVKKPIPEARKVESVHHFVDVGVSPAALQMTALRSDGSTLERCALSKRTRTWDCDGPPAASNAASSSGGARAADAAPPKARSACACDVVGAAPELDLGLAAVASASMLAMARRRARRAPS